MFVSRGKFYLYTSIIFIIGLLLIAYQKIAFEVPFTPELDKDIWTVEAKIEFEPKENQPSEVIFALPATQPGFFQLNQSSLSFGYGVNYLQKGKSNFIQWTKKSSGGLQKLYYRTEILKDDDFTKSSMIIPELTINTEREPYFSAMNEIASIAAAKSTSPYSFAAQVVDELNQAGELSSLLNSTYRRPELMVSILHTGKIHSKIIDVLNLENDGHNQKLKPYIAVFNKDKYIVLNPYTGESGLSENQIIWNDNENSLCDVYGGINTTVSFSTLKNSISAIKAAQQKAEAKGHSRYEILSFSIDSLPVETQCLLKEMLLLPIGVLIAVLLRVIVGIKTFGTFMPVLLAMTFLRTSPVFGLVGFIVIICIGLLVRQIFSHFNLLLVGRVSAMLISVIIIIGLTSFLTFKVGITEGVDLTFFPIIIISWTIEKISILWEEEGYEEVLKQGAGSIFVALCAYFPISSSLIQYFSFNFLGIQLMILAVVLLLGNYTGYKLTELKRFKPLAKQIRIYRNGDETEHESIRLKKELEEFKSDPVNIYKKWQKEIKEQTSKSENSKDSE